MNDGAAALVLMSKEKAVKLGLKPLAVIRGWYFSLPLRQLRDAPINDAVGGHISYRHDLCLVRPSGSDDSLRAAFGRVRLRRMWVRVSPDCWTTLGSLVRVVEGHPSDRGLWRDVLQRLSDSLLVGGRAGLLVRSLGTACRSSRGTLCCASVYRSVTAARVSLSSRG